ncbi:uncharacterized protein LOC130807223 isoform X2 [Amaranthus tricolor]|uniref:uncharacterized protein LOC130807223 isoform X2 n=1 Tax=Amaranthus tricolor TaxID=29722 RepID=UPI00258716A2|nr:uncharacterized protein LOC130807223 isoform X2 [Amaranthus tricolor]
MIGNKSNEDRGGSKWKKEKKKRVLVTFDIDGTLIRTTGPTSNNLHHRAFSHAFLQVFGIKGNIDVIQHHGSTDPAVLVNTLLHYGIPSEAANEKLSVLKSKMIEFAKDHAKDIKEGLEVLPGVEPLLQALSSKDNVTGNLEDIAWMKMKGLGIEEYFSVPHIGGFGSDHIDRGHLVRIAAERAEKLFPGNFDLRVHVGDTPNDIQAAESGGALAVGVCTGIFKKEELEQASIGGAVILPSLAVSQEASLNCGQILCPSIQEYIVEYIV